MSTRNVRTNILKALKRLRAETTAELDASLPAISYKVFTGELQKW